MKLTFGNFLAEARGKTAIVSRLVGEFIACWTNLVNIVNKHYSGTCDGFIQVAPREAAPAIT